MIVYSTSHMSFPPNYSLLKGYEIVVKTRFDGILYLAVLRCNNNNNKKSELEIDLLHNSLHVPSICSNTLHHFLHKK